MSSDSIGETMRRVQAESDLKSARFAAAQLRQYLSTALCAECGEPLGTDAESIQSDDQTKTLHATCAEEDED